MTAGGEGMEGMERIKRASRRLVWTFNFVLILTPIAVVLFWTQVGQQPSLARYLPVTLDENLPTWSRMLGLAVSLVPTSILMYATMQLSKLFRLYERGDIFARDNVRQYRSLGWSLIALGIAKFLNHTALSIVLTIHRPAGQRMLSIGINSDDVFLALIGMVVLTISWVMDEARKIEEEQSLII